MSGGKGGSNQTVAYYYAPVAFAICEGPIVGIKKIWAGGNLIFADNQPVAVNTYQGGGKKSGPTVSTHYQTFGSTTENDVQIGGSSLGPWTCYLGTETQPADPTIGEGVGYRGIAYIVFNPLNIGPGATIPPLTFEVVTVGSIAPPELLWQVTLPPRSAQGGVVMMDDGTIAIPSSGNNQSGTIGVAVDPTTGAVARAIYSNWLQYNYAGNAVMCNGIAYGTNAIYPATFNLENGLLANLYGTPSGTFMSGPITDGTGWVVWWQNAASGDGSGFNNVTIADVSGGYPEFTTYYPVGSTIDRGNVAPQCILNGLLYSLDELPSGGSNVLDVIDLGALSQVRYTALPGALPAIANIALIQTDGQYLYFFAQNVCYKTDAAFNLLLQFNVGGMANAVFDNGLMWIAPGNLYLYNTTTGALNATVAGVGGAITLLPNMMVVTNGSNGCTVAAISRARTIIEGTLTLPAAVEILCQRAGLTQYDVSLLPSIPVNFVRGDTVTARSMLSRLSQAYFFSMVDSGGVLRFVPQGQPSQAVIPLEDLGYDKVSTNAQTPFTASRISGVDLPRSVRIRYISAALNWERYEQVFALESYESGKEITLDLPLILDDQTAYNIAALACTLPHAERMQYAFTTSYKWLALEPGDVVTLPFGTCRLLTVKMGQKNGIPVIDFTACIDGMNSLAGAGYATPALPDYQPNAGGLTALIGAPANLAPVHTAGSSAPHPIATAPQMVQSVPNAGMPRMVLVEPPPLRSTDTGMRFMAGAYSTGNTFPGAAIFQSADGGVTYTQLTTEISATAAGYANTVLPVPNTEQGFYTWDTVSTVDVYMVGNGADPAPATDLQVMNGQNGAMLGQELIQYAQATLMTDSFGNPFYRLSRLLRGRRGTEWAMGTHQVGDPFYPIPSALSKEPYTPPMLNNAYLYKVVMMGGDLGSAPATSYEPNGNSLRQWAVAHLAATKDSANDWTISWVPRARYNGDFTSGYIPTLDNDTAGWSIDILSAGTVRRTINVPLQQAAPWQTVYTAAMQQADGFSPGSSGIGINCYQLSTSVGRGTVRSITTP